MMQSKKTFIPFSQRLVRGAIGKKYVIKHYRYGAVKTKYPDMTNIVASSKQVSCRERFKKANAFAKAIYNDPVQREQWREKLRRPRRLYNAIMQAYNKLINEEQESRLANTSRLIRVCFAENNNGTYKEMQTMLPFKTAMVHEGEVNILIGRKLLLAG